MYTQDHKSSTMHISLPSQLNTTLVLYILFSAIVILIAWIITLEMRLSKFMKGNDGRSLEDSIVTMKRSLDDYFSFKEDSIKYLKNIEARLKRSFQAAETIRFNPFKGTGSGGNQSFATVVLNEKGDGFVISSLYAREHVSVFSKPIKKFASEFEMSAEEREALKSAEASLLTHK